MNYQSCPKCGQGARLDEMDWNCGSYTDMHDRVHQSTNCRVRELEQENERLRVAIKSLLDLPLVPHLPGEMSNAYDVRVAASVAIAKGGEK